MADWEAYLASDAFSRGRDPALVALAEEEAAARADNAAPAAAAAVQRRLPASLISLSAATRDDPDAARRWRAEIDELERGATARGRYARWWRGLARRRARETLKVRAAV